MPNAVGSPGAQIEVDRFVVETVVAVAADVAVAGAVDDATDTVLASTDVVAVVAEVVVADIVVADAVVADDDILET